MVSIKHIQKAIAEFKAGDTSLEVQELIFKAVLQTRANGDDDIEEMDNINEAIRYLEVRLQNDHYRS